MDFNFIDTGITGNGKDIVYANGSYYMASINPGGVSYSSDLKNWTFKLLDEDDDNLDSITYGNSVFVIASNADNGIYTSSDGINWINRELKVYSNYAKNNIKASFNTVRFVNNQFVIVTGTQYTNSAGAITRREGHVLVSNNGINWTDKVELANSLMEIAYGNGMYVAVGTEGSIYTSTDLSNWTKRISNTSLKLVGVSFGKGLFVITGDSGTILTSSDGINWVKQVSNTDSYLIRSRYGNGMYVAVGYNCTVLTSIDGINWTEQDDGFTGGTWYGMVYANNRYVITGNHLVSTGNIPLLYLDVTRDLVDYENDCIFVYDKNLNLLGIIDEFISLQWTRKYFEAGEFELVVTPDENNIALLTNKDNILIRNNYTESAIIETYDIEDNSDEVELTVSGRFLSSIFDRRILQKTINFSGESINGMKTLINNATVICNNFEMETTQSVSKNIAFQCTYKNLYEYLVKLSKYSLVGFRLVPYIENKVYIFETYEGKDRSSLQNENERFGFSDDQANIDKASMIYYSKTEYNYALVGGPGEGSDRVLKTVKKGNTTGFDLREIFVDSKNQQDNTDIENQLISDGESALTDETFTFEATVNSDYYKDKWDLGDIVDLKKEDWGIVVQQRIIEVKEVIEEGKRTITPTFGTPLPEVFSE